MTPQASQKEAKCSSALLIRHLSQENIPSISYPSIYNDLLRLQNPKGFLQAQQINKPYNPIRSIEGSGALNHQQSKTSSQRTCDTLIELSFSSQQHLSEQSDKNERIKRTGFSLTQTGSQKKIKNSSLEIIPNMEHSFEKNTNQSSTHNTQEQKAYSSNDVSFDQKDFQYFKYENYSFRRLSHQHRTQALKLLTKSFIEEQPLAKAYYKQFPEEKEGAYAFWEEYWDMYMDDAIEGGVSLVIVDLANNEEVIGVYTFKNFNYVPDNPQLDEKYLRGFNLLSSQVMLEEELIQNSSSEIQDILLSSESIAEAWAAAIKVGHTGKKLYSKMTALAEKVLREAGFQYALVFASNFLSSKVVKKLDFTEAAELEVTQFEHLEYRPFAEIQELHKSPSLWFKVLQ